MVPSWIKMRVDLQDHPKVVRMARGLDSDRLRVIGGLWAVWSLFDTHSPDGNLDGYTLSEIDRSIGWPGFAQAMAGIGWLIEHDDGVEAPAYGEHNGATAKRRALDTKRKTGERNWSASDADTDAEIVRTASGEMSARNADEMWNRGRGRGRDKTKKSSSGEDPPRERAPAAEVCRALKSAGIAGVNPSHPRLIALLDAGAEPAEFLDAAPKAQGKADGFAYVLGVVEGRRRDAVRTVNGVHHGPLPRSETPLQREARERVEAAVPSLAARAPPPSDDGHSATSHPPMEVVDVVAKRVG